MGGKKKYIEMFGSFTEPFNSWTCCSAQLRMCANCLHLMNTAPWLAAMWLMGCLSTLPLWLDTL